LFLIIYNFVWKKNKNVIFVIKMKVDVVVARYNENIDWLSPLKHLCHIFNKGDEMQIDAVKSYNVLENIGRESGTYLQYIINNYPNFSDYTAFIQGDISDHVYDVNEFLNYIDNVDKGIIVPHEEYLGFTQISGYNGCGFIKSFNDDFHPDLPLEEWWFRLYDKPPKNDIILCNYCGLFMVSKERILFHPLDLYKKLHEWCLEEEPVGAYVLERLWMTLFDRER
jgi:hypothetical protein